MESKNEDSKDFLDAKIADELVKKILQKVPLRAGVKFRQTCRMMDKFVAEERICFPEERDRRYDLVAKNLRMDNDLMFYFNINRIGSSDEQYTHGVSVPINPNLGCVYFLSVSLNTYKDVKHPDYKRRIIPPISGHAMHLLESLNLRCCHLYTESIGISQIKRLTSMIPCKKFHNWAGQGLYEVIQVVSPTCLQIDTKIARMPADGIVLKRIRHLEKLEIKVEFMDCAKEFASFLQQARRSSTGNLKAFKLRIEGNHCYSDIGKVRRTDFWPAVRFVWKGATATQSNSYDTRIYLMDTPQKTAVISVCYTSKYKDEKVLKVRFVEKDDPEGIVSVVAKDVFKAKPVDMSHIRRDLERALPIQYPSVLREYLKNIMVFREFTWFYFML